METREKTEQIERRFTASIIQWPEKSIGLRHYDWKVFVDPLCREVNRAIITLYSERNQVDQSTIMLWLRKNSDYKDAVKDMSKFDDVLVVKTLDIKPLYQEILEIDGKRKLWKSLHEQSESAKNGKPPQSIIDSCRKVLDSVELQINDCEEIPSTETIAESASTWGERRKAVRDAGMVVGSGLRSLDCNTGGFWPGELVIIAGLPGTGKTAFGCQVCLANMFNFPILFFSLEMSNDAIWNRIACSRTGVNLNNISKGLQSQRERDTIKADVEKLKKSHLLTVDKTCTINDIERYSRIYKKKSKIRAIFIDHFMKIINTGKGEWWQQNQEKSQSLVNLAKELQVPVILFSQIIADSSQKKSDKPTKLRATSALGEDCDVKIVLKREIDSNMMDYSIEKNKNGPCKSGTFFFDGESQRFSDFPNSMNDELMTNKEPEPINDFNRRFGDAEKSDTVPF